MNRPTTFLLASALSLTIGLAARAESDFTKDIKPILEKSCAKCHGTSSPKAKLNLTTRETMLKGGDSGAAIVPGNAEDSLLVELISLDKDDPEHMPAEGDLLTEDQIKLIRAWIDEGAKWPEDVKIAVPEAEDPLKKDPLNTPGLPISEAEKQGVETVQKQGALAIRIAQNTNWLRVDFSLNPAGIKDEQLAVLKDMPNLVELDLGGTQVSDAGLEQIATLTNLYRLHLEKTNITGPGLANLKNLQNLTYLNLYGSQVTDEGLAHLAGLKNLKKLYLWQTKVSDEAVAKLQEALPQLDINRGVELAVKVEAAEEVKEDKAEAKEPDQAEKKEEAKKEEAKQDAPKDAKPDQKDEAKPDQKQDKDQRKDEDQKKDKDDKPDQEQKQDKSDN